MLYRPYWSALGIAALFLNGLAQLASTSAAQPAKQAPQVIVEVIRKPVFRGKRKNDPKKEELLPGKGEGPDKCDYPLEAGRSWVECGKGGEVRIWTPTPRSYDKPGWYPVPRISPNHEDPLREIPNIRLIIAGRKRGPGPCMIWPSSFSPSAVRPGSFEVRWDAKEAKGGKVALRLLTSKGKQILWSKRNIDGKAGHFSDERLRIALIEWRKKNGGVAVPLERRAENAPSVDRLTLVFAADWRPAPEEVQFDVLEVRAEAKLAKQLKAWDELAKDDRSRETRVMIQLGRAMTFQKYELLPEMVQESEEALKLDPNNRTLKQLVYGSYEYLGDVSGKRVLDLFKELYESPRDEP